MAYTQLTNYKDEKHELRIESFLKFLNHTFFLMFGDEKIKEGTFPKIKCDVLDTVISWDDEAVAARTQKEHVENYKAKLKDDEKAAKRIRKIKHSKCNLFQLRITNNNKELGNELKRLFKLILKSKVCIENTPQCYLYENRMSGKLNFSHPGGKELYIRIIWIGENI
jgi:hypothetical protein